MGVESSLIICNLALAAIGHTPITSLSDTDQVSITCNLLYEPMRNALLRKFPWQFAIKRRVLEPVYATITGATQANPVVVTAPAHGFRGGNTVLIDDMEGMTELNGKTVIVSNAVTNTFVVLDASGVNVDGTAYGAYSAGGTARLRPLFQYEYEYALPTDCLRAWKLYDTTSPWLIENKHLLIDDDEVNLRYIAAISDTTLFDDTFVRALAYDMASELSVKIADNKVLLQLIRDRHREVILEAFRLDAIEGDPEDESPEDTSWQSAGRA